MVVTKVKHCLPAMSTPVSSVILSQEVAVAIATFLTLLGRILLKLQLLFVTRHTFSEAGAVMNST